MSDRGEAARGYTGGGPPIVNGRDRQVYQFRDCRMSPNVHFIAIKLTILLPTHSQKTVLRDLNLGGGVPVAVPPFRKSVWEGR